jgi:hypothetical protein
MAAICRPNANNPTRYQDMPEVTTNAEIVTISDADFELMVEAGS